MKTALEILAEVEDKPFSPGLKYYQEGNFLTYFAKDLPCVARQIDHVLTVYEDDAGEIVGVRINEAR